MARQAPNKSSKVSLPLADFGRALTLCTRFNLSSGVRQGQRVQVVLSQALREVQPFVAAIKTGHRVESGYHGGSDDLLTYEIGREEAAKQSAIAHREGKVSVALSETGGRYVAAIKEAFKLSNDGQAATLAVRIYDRMLDNLWRGNHLSIWDKDNNRVPYDESKLRDIAVRLRVK